MTSTTQQCSMADQTRSQKGKYRSVKGKKQPLCARTSYSCYKLTLFIYSFCYLIIGLCLLGIGIYIEIERREYAQLDTTLSLPVALLIFVGFFVSVNGLCGIVGTVEENVNLLRLFLILSVASFLGQIVTAVVIYVYGLNISSYVSSDLAEVLRQYNSKLEVRETMDTIQSKFSCCGISSWQDYVDIASVCQPGGKCTFPTSCCSDTQFPNKVQNCTTDTVEEVSTYITSKVGCFHAFIDWLGDRMDLIGATTLGLALPQVAGIILTYLVLRRIKEYHCWYTVEMASDYENRL